MVHGAGRPPEQAVPCIHTASQVDPGTEASSLLPRIPVPALTYLPMHIPAEAGGQALGPQDQVALVTKAIQQDVILLILGISTVVRKDYHVSLQQRYKVGTCSQLEGTADRALWAQASAPLHTLSQVSLAATVATCPWEGPSPRLQHPNSNHLLDSVTSTSNLYFQLTSPKTKLGLRASLM